MSDLDGEGLPFDVTLVVANLTVAVRGAAQPAQAARRRRPAPLHRRRPAGARRRAARSPRRASGSTQLLDSLRVRGHRGRRHDRRPRPLHGDHERRRSTSTSPRSSSRRCPRRARSGSPTSSSSASRARSNKPVEHVESGRRRRSRPDGSRRRPASTAHHEHHGPPEANRSSRVDPGLLGMLLFIISRGDGLRGLLHGLLLHPGRGRRRRGRRPGTELPKLIAGVNTRDPAVVVVHDALGARDASRPATGSG